MVKHLTSNTSHFILCETTCFGPYVTIIRPFYEFIDLIRKKAYGLMMVT